MNEIISFTKEGGKLLFKAISISLNWTESNAAEISAAMMAVYL